MCSVIALLHQSRIAMDAALELVRARPASRAFVLARLLRDGDHFGALEREPVALDEAVARLVRLLEEELRVELDDRDVQAELADDHVHENGRLALPRARQAHAVPELLVGPDERVLGAQRLEVRKLELWHHPQGAPPSACRRATRAS